MIGGLPDRHQYLRHRLAQFDRGRDFQLSRGGGEYPGDFVPGQPQQFLYGVQNSLLLLHRQADRHLPVRRLLPRPDGAEQDRRRHLCRNQVPGGDGLLAEKIYI